MTRLNVDGPRCEALFASELQRSDAPTAESVTEAISRTVRRLGTRGCAGRMAQEFGDHPQAAAERMRWIRPPRHRRPDRSIHHSRGAALTTRPGDLSTTRPTPGLRRKDITCLLYTSPSPRDS